MRIFAAALTQRTRCMGLRSTLVYPNVTGKSTVSEAVNGSDHQFIFEASNEHCKGMRVEP
jgi:hypothetical protein